MKVDSAKKMIFKVAVFYVKFKLNEPYFIQI